jgi:hypothetical protein
MIIMIIIMIIILIRSTFIVIIIAIITIYIFYVSQLLYRQRIPPNQNLSATAKKSLRSALFDLYHKIMWDCLSKVITSESGDSLSCLSEVTDIIVHRATPLPVPPTDSPLNPSKIDLFENDDAAGLCAEDSFETGSQSPTQESSKVPTPRFLPKWRRFFRRSSDVRMVTAELKEKATLEEGLAAALSRNKNGLVGTPPETNMNANELPKYTGKYLLVQHGKVTTVEAETGENDTGSSSCCQLITASERDMRKRVSDINHGGKRNIFREHLIVQLTNNVEVHMEHPAPPVEPPPVKNLYRDISVMNSKTRMGVKSNLNWTGSELVTESQSGTLGADADTDCWNADPAISYKVETTGYLDLRILVCSHAARDSQSKITDPPPDSTEPLYTDIGGGPFGPLADRARLITSVAAWRHFYIFSLICLRS